MYIEDDYYLDSDFPCDYSPDDEVPNIDIWLQEYVEGALDV